MPDKSPQNHDTTNVGRSLKGQTRRQDGEVRRTVAAVIPVRPRRSPIEVPERRCWRCLHMFPGDPAREPTPTPEWWLCDPCEQMLLGSTRRAA